MGECGVTCCGGETSGDRSRPLSASDLTFVVRASGERTAEAAVTELRRQLGPGLDGAVRVVRERPFARAVRRTMEIGASSDRPWTIGMDADVLLVSDGVARLVELCRQAGPATFTVTGLMLCKLYGGFVFRGIHCYRSELLDRAAGVIGRSTPGGPDPALKPESAVVHAMDAMGFGYEGKPVVLAAHDFEQSYRHIYLKMRMRARREAEAMQGHGGGGGDPRDLAEFCRDHAARGDLDFMVAGWGVEDGIADGSRPRAERPAMYDWHAAWPEFDSRCAACGLVEKAPWAAGAARGYADRAIAAHDWASDTRTPKWIRDLYAGRAAA